MAPYRRNGMRVTPETRQTMVACYRQFAPSERLREHVRAFFSFMPAAEESGPAARQVTRQSLFGSADQFVTPMFADANASIVVNLGLRYGPDRVWVSGDAPHANVIGPATEVGSPPSSGHAVMVGVYFQPARAAQFHRPAAGRVDRSHSVARRCLGLGGRRSHDGARGDERSGAHRSPRIRIGTTTRTEPAVKNERRRAGVGRVDAAIAGPGERGAAGRRSGRFATTPESRVSRVSRRVAQAVLQPRAIPLCPRLRRPRRACGMGSSCRRAGVRRPVAHDRRVQGVQQLDAAANCERAIVSPLHREREDELAPTSEV
jgi:hypothetical protein